MVTTPRQNVLVSLVLCLALKFVFNSILRNMQAAIHSNEVSSKWPVYTWPVYIIL